MPKVAVITRTKDRPIFLRRAIQSVANQTYQDYVHVIINDGGDKKEIEDIIAELDEDSAQNIKIFHRDKASNAPDSIFNESIDRIESEYFAIHDDDDTWHQDFLQTTVRHLNEHQLLGAVVVRSDKIVEALQGTMIHQKKQSHWMPDLKVINLYRQCLDNQLTPIATLFRRSAYEAVGKFDSTLPVVGDWEFGVRLLQKYEIDFVDPGFALAYYHHRVRADNSFAAHDHRYYINMVMNKYLREELAEGRLGVGYIMSQLRYNQAFISSLFKRFLPIGVANRLKKRASN